MSRATGKQQHASFDLAASGDLVSLVAGKRIAVKNYMVTGAAGITAKFESGGTSDLTGTMIIGDDGHIDADSSDDYLFVSVAGEKLNLVTSGAVDGHLSYDEIN